MKRMLAILLSAVMLAAVFPAAAFADESASSLPSHMQGRSYMPEARTLLTNITFDGFFQDGDTLPLTMDGSERFIDSSVVGVNTKPANGTDGVVLQKDEEDNFYAYKSKSMALNISPANKLDNKKSLVISFKFKKAAADGRLVLRGSNLFSDYWERQDGASSGTNYAGALICCHTDGKVYTIGQTAVGNYLDNEWNTIDIQITSVNASLTSNTIRADFVAINGTKYDINKEYTSTKKVPNTAYGVDYTTDSAKCLKMLGTLGLYLLSGKDGSNAYFDDIAMYEPAASVESLSVAYGSTIRADEEVSVTFSSRPSAEELNGIKISKWNGSTFAEVTNASFEADGVKAVLKSRLDCGSVYKITAENKSVVFSTFAAYMPGIASKKAMITFEGDTDTSYPCTALPSTNSSAIVDSAKYGASNKAYSPVSANLLHASIISSTDFYNKTGIYSDIDNVNEMVISFEYNDDITTGSGDIIALTGQNPWISGAEQKISDFNSYNTSAIFAVNLHTSTYQTFGSLYSNAQNLPDGYQKGWHRVDIKLTAKGMDWLALDGNIIGKDISNGKDYTSIWNYGLPTVSQMNKSWTSANKTAVDNIAVYIPQKTSVTGFAIARDSAESNKVIVSANVSYNGESKKVMLVVACKEDGNVKNLVASESVVGGSAVNISMPVVLANPSNSTKICAYILDSNGLVPICDKLEKSYSEVE